VELPVVAFLRFAIHSIIILELFRHVETFGMVTKEAILHRLGLIINSSLVALEVMLELR